MKNIDTSADAANKVVDLLTKAADQVGHTAVTAFPYVVQYEWTQAMIGSTVGAILLLVALISGFRWYKWLSSGFNEKDEVLGYVSVGLFIACSIFGSMFVGLNLATAIEPTGSTIEQLLYIAARISQ